VSPRTLLLAAACLFAVTDARAIGLTQVNEARPHREHEHSDADDDWHILLLDLFLGSNFVSWYGGSHVEGVTDGRVSFTNWVNNGEFYNAVPGEDWNVNAALVQRSSWLSSHGDSPLPSYTGLTALWIDLTLRHHEKDSPWSQAVVLSPGISSDLANVAGPMFRLPVQMSAQYRVAKNLAFELGVAYTPDFTQTPLLPLPGIEWDPAEDWEVRYRLTTLTVTHHITPETSLGVFAAYDAASWLVGEKAGYGQLSFTSANAGVEAVQKFRIHDVPGALHLAVGGTFANETRLYDADGSRLLTGTRSDGGVFARVGLTLRF
jgi:hypothetical protein